MQKDDLRDFLEKIKAGKMSVDDGVSFFNDHYYVDVGCAKIDMHREGRVGYPEVIFCPGKTPEQVKAIIKAMLEKNSNILATRANAELFAVIKELCPGRYIIPAPRPLR
jgi:NCAIR mutase (PurE)-related protein